LDEIHVWIIFNYKIIDFDERKMTQIDGSFPCWWMTQLDEHSWCFEMNLISSMDYGLKFCFVHELDWNSSTQVYEWKFIYLSSGIHGQNKSLDDIPWMKLNSSWNTMNSLPIFFIHELGIFSTSWVISQ
jgi:hypothetical protein